MVPVRLQFDSEHLHMVHLSRIYTRSGDKGQTFLANNQDVEKFSPVINAVGEIDEANCAIGLIYSLKNLDGMEVTLHQIQNDLFNVGAQVSGSTTLKISEKSIKRLEDLIDYYNDDMPPLESFVLPGGSKVSALFHNARAVVRRAERAVWAVIWPPEEELKVCARYLNRLSDLLFVLARLYNEEEILWRPGEDVQID